MAPIPSPPSTGRAPSRSARRRKNLFVDQRKIDRAKQVFGVATETEAIDRALDLAEDFAAFQREVEEGMEALVGRGGFVESFDRHQGDGT
jgi:hypothetical protein